LNEFEGMVENIDRELRRNVVLVVEFMTVLKHVLYIKGQCKVDAKDRDNLAMKSLHCIKYHSDSQSCGMSELYGALCEA
jgi:hypothetical protein